MPRQSSAARLQKRSAEGGVGQAAPVESSLARWSIEVPDLVEGLHELLAQIPEGRVTTYGALAEALGAVSAARWVASYLLAPDGPAELPRHRVVLRQGALGKFWTGDVAGKARLLESEGVIVQEDRVDLNEFGFTQFVGSRPLAELQAIQEALLDRLELHAPAMRPEFVGGVDVSYQSARHAGPVEGVAAYVRVHVPSGAVVWRHAVRRPVRFPYIPGFLAFRELPILLELLGEVREHGELADVLFVDGNGILHHRHAGIATHLGIVTGLSTIGIGKSLLCGSADLTKMTPGERRPVRVRGEIVAQALQPRGRRKPVFVSPGHRVDLPFAAELTERLLASGPVPVPIAGAHDYSRRVAAGRL